MRVLVDAREKLHIAWGDQDNQQHGDSLMAFDTRSAKMASGQLETSVFLQYLPAIRALWADSGIQHAYDRRREFQLVGDGGAGGRRPAWVAAPVQESVEKESESPFPDGAVCLVSLPAPLTCGLLFVLGDVTLACHFQGFPEPPALAFATHRLFRTRKPPCVAVM